MSMLNKDENAEITKPRTHTHLFFGKADLDGVRRADLEPLKRISGRCGLFCALKLHKSNIRSTRNQAHLFEPRELWKKGIRKFNFYTQKP